METDKIRIEKGEIMGRILILLLVNILFFAKTITYKYVSDDIPVWRNSKDFPCKPWMRWFWALEGSIRTNQQLDHFLTLIIHAFTSVMVYVAFGSNDVSFAAALLFSFNPINNQGSVWISGRSYAMSCLFFLITIKYPWIGIISIIAMMNYPVGYVMAPALGFFNIWLMIPVAIGLVIYYKRIRGCVDAKVNSEMFYEDRRIHPKKIIIVLKTFGFYTIHALLPIKTTFYHSFLQSMSGSGREKSYKVDRFFYLGTIFASLFSYKLFFMPFDVYSLGIIMWIAGIAPFLNAFRISQEIAERYTYAALPGLMICLSGLISWNPYLISFWIGMYACKLWFWMDAYQDDYYLVENSCLADPGAWFAWHVRALKRWDVQSHKEAMIMWTMAKMISPNEFKVLLNLATMLKMHGQHKEADQFIKMAEDNIPKGQEASAGDIIKKWKKGKFQIAI